MQRVQTALILISAVLLTLFALFTILAPMNYRTAVADGDLVASIKPIYGWADLRVPVVEAASVVSLLASLSYALRSSPRRWLPRAVGVAGLVFCVANLTLVVAINYAENLTIGAPPSSLTSFSNWAYGLLLSVHVLGFGQRLLWLPGDALTWALASSATFLVLRIGRGRKAAAVDGVLFFLAILAVYELGIRMIDPQWADVHVTLLQVGSPLAWFTNNDLLYTSFVGAGCIIGLRLIRPRKLGDSNITPR